MRDLTWSLCSCSTGMGRKRAKHAHLHVEHVPLLRVRHAHVLVAQLLQDSHGQEVRIAMHGRMLRQHYAPTRHHTVHEFCRRHDCVATGSRYTAGPLFSQAERKRVLLCGCVGFWDRGAPHADKSQQHAKALDTLGIGMEIRPH